MVTKSVMKTFVTTQLDPRALARIAPLAGELVIEPWQETGTIYQGDELAERVLKDRFDHLIVEVDILHEDFWEGIAGRHRVRTISVCRADPLTVDREAATAAGVPVFFTPARNAQAVAELTLGMMIAHARRVVDAHNLLKSKRFEPASPKDFMKTYGTLTGYEIGTRTVGIVGMGAIGRMVAERLRPFGSTLLGFDPYVDAMAMERLGVRKCAIDPLMAEADLVTIHCPLNEETLGLIGPAQIARMKPTAVLLNLARADVVDDDALYDALAGDKIAGACLDVFHQEPVLPDNRFLDLPNVLVTPHIGGASSDVAYHQGMMIARALEGYFAGGPPADLVANPEVLDRLESPR